MSTDTDPYRYRNEHADPPGFTPLGMPEPLPGAFVGVDTLQRQLSAAHARIRELMEEKLRTPPASGDGQAEFMDRLRASDAPMADHADLQAHLATMKPASVAVTIDPAQPLPCEVRLPPATTLKAGCTWQTLLSALSVEGRHRFDEPEPIMHANGERLTCIWKYDPEDELWVSSCEKAHDIHESDNLRENGWHFCPTCGLPLIEDRSVSASDMEPARAVGAKSASGNGKGDIAIKASVEQHGTIMWDMIRSAQGQMNGMSREIKIYTCHRENGQVSDTKLIELRQDDRLYALFCCVRNDFNNVEIARFQAFRPTPAAEAPAVDDATITRVAECIRRLCYTKTATWKEIARAALTEALGGLRG